MTPNEEIIMAKAKKRTSNRIPLSQESPPFKARRIFTHDRKDYIDWSESDERSALQQGWGLFDYDGSEIVTILKMDDPPAHSMWRDGWATATPFSSDEEALGYVRARAEMGDNTARLALSLHESNVDALEKYR